jgi:hypothetical protein
MQYLVKEDTKEYSRMHEHVRGQTFNAVLDPEQAKVVENKWFLLCRTSAKNSRGPKPNPHQHQRRAKSEKQMLIDQATKWDKGLSKEMEKLKDALNDASTNQEVEPSIAGSWVRLFTDLKTTMNEVLTEVKAIASGEKEPTRATKAFFTRVDTEDLPALRKQLACWKGTKKAAGHKVKGSDSKTKGKNTSRRPRGEVLPR